MNRNDRQHFFKYTIAETGKLIISSRKLRWSSLLFFNDPAAIQSSYILKIVV